MTSVTSFFTYTVDGDEQFQKQLTVEPIGDGVELVHLVLDAQTAVAPKPVTLHFTVPLVGVNGIWYPKADTVRTNHPGWVAPIETCLTVNAPVTCFFGGNTNRLTFAADDAMNVLALHSGANEKTGNSYSTISFFSKPTPPLAHYEVTVRFDRREIPFYDALADVAAWWETLDGCQPCDVPEYARLPMYSTWYSYMQDVTAADVERECRIAKDLGCYSVITDDGWQCENVHNGYGLCGDWRPSAAKMGNMAEHVARVHDMGMKYLLWYSVPYVGWNADCYGRFKDRTLRSVNYWDCDVLDPRYRETREYLIRTYEKAAEDWGLDGFKLDFVDQFLQPKAEDEKPDLGRDETSVMLAADQLMTEVMKRLKTKNPDVMIEFRQRYTGPRMRKFGNMFRAADCPNDPVMNRVRIVDIRLLCGQSAAHSDMVHWHVGESAETAALNLINVLFSVPQISVRLAEYPESHRQMLRFYLTFWKEHRDLLLDAKFRPLYPDLLYPVITAERDGRMLAAVYGAQVVPASEGLQELILVNGCFEDGVFVDFGEDGGTFEAVEQDCLGQVTARYFVQAEGVRKLSLRSAGVLTLKRV